MYLMATKEPTLDEIDENAPDGPNQLRQFAERAAAKGARADSLERELAAVKLGIDVDSRLGKAWLQGFAGDFGDAPAVLADATEFSPTIIKGYTAPTASTEGQGEEEAGSEVTAPVSNEAQARNALADGALPAAGAQEDTASLSLRLAEQSIDKGGTVPEAMGGLINMRANAVATGKMQPLLPNGQRPRQ
jgi:hypothetical protein